ncbi:MAG: S9 family peptidase [Acidobacteriota bacterium]
MILNRLALLMFVTLLGVGVSNAGASDAEDLVRRLAGVKSCTSPSFSPDGRTLAFVSDMSGTPQVWTVPVGGGWPRQQTALEDTVFSARFAPKGDRIAVTAAPGGGMNTQVYLISQDGTEVERITAGGRETNRLGPWSADGRTLALGSNERSAAALDGYLYDLEKSEKRRVFESEGLGSIVDVSQDGSVLLVSRLAGRGSNDLFARDVASGDELLLTPHEGPGSYGGELSRGGDVVYLSSNTDRDLIAFGRQSLQRSESGELVAGDFELLAERDDAELGAFAVDPRDKRVALVWNVAGRSELEILDLATTERRPIALGVDLIGGLSWATNGRSLAMVGSGAQQASNVYVLSLTTGFGKRITDCPHPGVEMETLVVPELVRFAAHDGLELSGWLYRPEGADGPQPYVLSFHGGPEGQERPRLRSDYQALLASGIGVFAPNIRGSSGFGKRFVNLDNRELRFDANRDIESAARHLVAEGIADEKRLGIMGGSYGGYAVMVGVTDYPDLFAAGVNLFGMVNFETFFANTEPWMAAISGTEYGDPKTQKDLLKKLSPIYKLKQVKTPLLVLHGANDTNVPVVEADQVVETLRKRRVPVDYILFPDEGHGFRKEVNRLRSTTATVDWFAKYLKN